MAFCENCGANVNPGDQFCDNCGASLGAATIVEKSPQPERQLMPKLPVPARVKKIRSSLLSPHFCSVGSGRSITGTS